LCGISSTSVLVAGTHAGLTHRQITSVVILDIGGTHVLNVIRRVQKHPAGSAPFNDAGLGNLQKHPADNLRMHRRKSL